MAIATTWDGGAAFSCAVLPWCQQAELLAKLLINSVGVRSAKPIMLVTDNHDSSHMKRGRGPEHRNPWATLAEDCPNAQVARLDPRLQNAASLFARSPTGGCRSITHKRKHVWSAGMLYKWWAVSLTQYTLVLFSDLDVQLLRPEQPQAQVIERWRSTWNVVVPPDGSSRLDAERDSISPMNGGLWTLARPTTAMYERGLAVLERPSWNSTHGFDLIGTPRQIFQRAGRALRRRMARTKMCRRNTWAVEFGDCDQGFLFYVFFLLEDIGGARVRLPTRRMCIIVVSLGVWEP